MSLYLNCRVSTVPKEQYEPSSNPCKWCNDLPLKSKTPLPWTWQGSLVLLQLKFHVLKNIQTIVADALVNQVHFRSRIFFLIVIYSPLT